MEEQKGRETKPFQIADQVIHDPKGKHLLFVVEILVKESVPGKPDEKAQFKEEKNGGEGELLFFEGVLCGFHHFEVSFVHFTDAEH